ncbi:FAD dependent oxidoreductase-domain-containing protein [Entophlyctis helioformis]|nr:FAD dependent oxidoreductase-domain-containing protein [Entophlyctis helioformis]
MAPSLADIEDLAACAPRCPAGAASASASGCSGPSGSCPGTCRSVSASAPASGESANNSDNSGGDDNTNNDETAAPANVATMVHDVVIIGAGAVGSAIARELSRYRLSVVVLDKATDVSQGASKSNSGIVHGGYDERHGTLKAKLAHHGNQLFRKLESELHFGFREIGSLVLAFSKDEMPGLEALLQNGRLNGVERLSIIYRDEILKMEPHIAKDVYAALYCPDAGITSPYEYTIALAENAADNGVRFMLGHEVVDIQRVNDRTSCTSNSDGHHYLIRTSRDGHTFRAKTVVNAAGLYSDRIAAMVGANNFHITPRKGEYILLNRTQGEMATRVLFPLPSAKRGKGILVSPTYHGNLLLGPTSRGSDEASMTQREVLQFIISAARHSVPDFDVGEAITSYTGLRAKCSRGDFVIEESESAHGFVNAAGIDSPGLTSSPAIALMVAEILRKSLKTHHGVTMDLDPFFNPNRRPILIKKTAAFRGAIDDPDPARNIVCRCERVTEAEIIDAINRPLCPADTDGIKRRTRTGMGHCQGNFCEDRVAAIVAREARVPLQQVQRHSAGSSILPHRRVTDADRQLLRELALAESAEKEKKQKLVSKL